MPRIDLTASTASEAKLLAELLSFFDPPEGVRLRFLCPPEARKDIELKHKWLEIIIDKPKPEHQVQVVCSSSAGNLARESLQLWSSNALSCIELGRDPSLFKQAREFCVGYRFCCLDSEPLNLKGIEPLQVWPELSTGIASQAKTDILVTRSPELRQALFIDSPEDLWHILITAEGNLLDLRLDDSAEAYLRAYRQLMALCQALSESQQISLEALRRNYDKIHGSYSFFAEFYDRYMAHVDYSAWLTMILSWARRFYAGPLVRALELACGTANIAEQLVFKGMEVDACDLSPFMLREAARKCFKPHLFRASLDTPLPHRDCYDLVLCLFDSVNYLLDIAELKATLTHVRAALKPGALFVFDISTLQNSRENFDDLVQHHRFGNALIVHHASFDELGMRQKSSLTLYRKRHLGFVMSEEHHTQRVYRHREILSVIASSQMELLGIFNPDTRSNLLSKRHQNLDEQYSRLFYMLRRPL